MTKTWTLEWAQAQPGVWRSTNRAYIIMSVALPECGPLREAAFQVRKVDPASARVYPDSFGYLLAEVWSLDHAKTIAERDAWSDAQGAACHVPEDYPALTLSRFFWRISNGTHRGALAVVRRDGRTFAQVVGMGRSEADIYEPRVCAEIEITPALMAGEPSGPAPDPCGDVE